jgi:hypothetical protein
VEIDHWECGVGTETECVREGEVLSGPEKDVDDVRWKLASLQRSRSKVSTLLFVSFSFLFFLGIFEAEY